MSLIQSILDERIELLCDAVQPKLQKKRRAMNFTMLTTMMVNMYHCKD